MMEHGLECFPESQSWQSLIQELQQSNLRLAGCLSEGDWDKAQEEIAHRDLLLRHTSLVIQHLKDQGSKNLPPEELHNFQEALMSVLAVNREYVEQIEIHRREVGQQLEKIQEGRARLPLHRTERLAPTPRFLDRKG